MLGKLARWLRFLGVDAAYARDLHDDAVLALARAEERVLVTRDVHLAERARDVPGSFLVRSLDPDAQLTEVTRGLPLRVDPALFLTRCAACNTPLAPATAADAARAPDGVRATTDAADMWACPGCGRVYWEGTHHARILARLRDLETGE